MQESCLFTLILHPSEVILIREAFKKSVDRIQAISHSKIEKIFLGPDFFIIHFLGNILMIYAHWHHQNSFFKLLEP